MFIGVSGAGQETVSSLAILEALLFLVFFSTLHILVTLNNIWKVSAAGEQEVVLDPLS